MASLAQTTINKVMCATKINSNTATWPAGKTHLDTAHLLSKRKQKHQYKSADVSTFYLLYYINTIFYYLYEDILLILGGFF